MRVPTAMTEMKEKGSFILSHLVFFKKCTCIFVIGSLVPFNCKV